MLRLCLRLAVTAISLFALTSCIPDPSGDVGVAQSSSGDVPVLHLALCEGDTARAVSVADPVDGVIGDANDIVYWQVSRTGSGTASPTSIQVGGEPSGFEL